MHLGGKKIKGRGFESGLGEYPKPIETEVLNGLVTRLRSGDNTVQEQIILGHIGLTLSIAARYVNFFPAKAEDIAGVGLLALTEAVVAFSDKAIDNNIGGFIVAKIHGYISNFLKEDNTVTVTRSHFQQILESDDAVLPTTTCINNTKPSDDGDFESVYDHPRLRVYDDDTKLQVDEILTKANFTRYEATVVRKLVEGYTEAEIAREMNKSRQVINLVKKRVAEILFNTYSEQLILTAKFWRKHA